MSRNTSLDRRSVVGGLASGLFASFLLAASPVSAEPENTFSKPEEHVVYDQSLMPRHSKPVALHLVLVTDFSKSIDDHRDYPFLMQGMSKALLHERVWRAIQSRGDVMLSHVFFATDAMYVGSDIILADDPGAWGKYERSILKRYGNPKTGEMPPRLPLGKKTNVVGALDVAAKVFRDGPLAHQKKLDIAGDGIPNMFTNYGITYVQEHGYVEDRIQNLAEQGCVTVNALGVPNGNHDMHMKFYRKTLATPSDVQGGYASKFSCSQEEMKGHVSQKNVEAGQFFEADEMRDFGDAMLDKLLIEISGLPEATPSFALQIPLHDQEWHRQPS